MARKEDDNIPRGERAQGSIIDGRDATRKNLAATQSNRFAENKLIVGEVTDEEVAHWKKLMREFTGLHHAGNTTISQVEGGVQMLLGSRYSSENDPRRKKAYYTKEVARTKILQLLTSWPMRNFEKDERITDEYKIAWQNLRQRMIDLGKIHQSVTGEADESLSEEQELVDASFAQTLADNYVRLRKGSHAKFARIAESLAALEEHDSKPGLYAKRERPLTKMIRDFILAQAVILISHGYYLTRHFSQLSENPQLQEAVASSLQTIQELSTRLSGYRERMLSLGYPVELSDVVPPELVQEAEEVWSQLVR